VAYSQNRFSLGVAAFFANEGLALYIVEKISIKFEIKKIKIGLLGMAFKADNDDIRSSLSYRVRKALQLAGAEVIAADQNVLYDQSLVSEKEVLSKSDLIIICAPHEQYKYFNYMDKPVVDIWNLLGQGSLI
jgi:UDP-N-acetyl-D-mannosaminuronic acid dehydrogenase